MRVGAETWSRRTAHATRGIADRQNSSPAAVRRYSTRGGTSACTVRATRPARSRPRKRAASVFGLIRPSLLWISVYRSRPWFARVPTISTDHFRATASSTPSRRWGHTSAGDFTRGHPGTTGRDTGRLSFREVTLSCLRGTAKYFPMDSSFDGPRQERASPASARQVPALLPEVGQVGRIPRGGLPAPLVGGSLEAWPWRDEPCT